ncbi:MAG TPA: indole-3-glycerol phosphate synthase TrpC [Bryobacteraceae bacterium]|nr:indole-3-glycerol phosphate synthase TrpC [Bryobacteraceae bacterium]
MTSSLPDILARIVQHKHAELAERTETLEELQARAVRNTSLRRDFTGALKSGIAIIAEIKKASPSKGRLSADGAFQPDRIAATYQDGGAAALSVLTDSHFFQGSLADLKTARAAVDLPVLRKDFTIDSSHVLEAAAAGADAILLIAAVLTDRQLREYRELAARYRMAALVEVHDSEELQRALDSGAEILGVNNRDLRTFEVRLETSLDLAGRMPSSCIRVSESGISGRSDIDRLRAAGYDAFLIGEHLMRSGSPEATLRELTA